MRSATSARRAQFLREALIGTVLLGVACAHDAAPRFNAETQVAAWVELWRTYDLDRLDDLFVRDTTLTYFSSEREGLIRGYPAVLEHHRAFGFVSGGRAPTAELWVDSVIATPTRDGAVVTGMWYFGNRRAAQHQRGPFTFVYVWRDGGYRLVHLHFDTY